MKFTRLLTGLSVACCFSLLCLSACVERSDQAKPKEQKPAEDAVAQKPAPAHATFKASEDDCVGPIVKSQKPREINFGDWKFLLDGYLLKQLNSDPDEEVIVGVLSDTKENTPENKKNLTEILEYFKSQGVNVIIHLGDVATVTPLPEEIDVPDKDKQGNPLTKEERARARRRAISKARQISMRKSYDDIIDMLSVLAESELPVLVLSGNRECKSVFNTAMTTLAEDYPNLFNMNMIRRLDLDDLDIISMPGYHDPEYVHCPWDKCLYYESDTLALMDLAKEANNPVLLISHGGPRQNGRDGIDVVSEGVNVGNPALAAIIRKANIPFGAFGNIQEAGGKATNLDGTSIISQNTFVRSLYLNPGPAASIPWSMNDGTESHGMAGVIHFVGNRAKYQIYRVGQSSKATHTAANSNSKETAAKEDAVQ